MHWTGRLSAVLGGLLVTIGFWLVWGDLPVAAPALLALGVTAFLLWRGRTLPLVWAWTSLLLGLESLAWPIATMVQVKLGGAAEPTDEQMRLILTAVLFGLPSAIFMLSFAYGIFHRIAKQSKPDPEPATEEPDKQSDGRRTGKKR
jgi:hypothetical protein